MPELKNNNGIIMPKAVEKNSALSFEEALKKLEKIVSDIEGGEIPLDKTIELYEEGMNLSKFCLDTLDKHETKLKKLTKNLDGSFELKDMND